jgi:hypothetical protein
MKQLFRLILVWHTPTEPMTPFNIRDIETTFWYGEASEIDAILATKPHTMDQLALLGVEETPLRRASAVLVRTQVDPDVREAITHELTFASYPYNLLAHISVIASMSTGWFAVQSDIYSFAVNRAVFDTNTAFPHEAGELLAAIQQEQPTITADQCNIKVYTKIIEPSRNKAILEAALHELESTS